MTSMKAIIKETTEDVIMIILGIVIFVISNRIIQVCALVALIVVAIYSFLEGVSRIIANQDRIKFLREENKKLKDEINAINDLQKTQKSVSINLPHFDNGNLSSNTETLKTFLESLIECNELPIAYLTYFRNVSDLLKVDMVIGKIKENTSVPFTEMLKQCDIPLSEEQKIEIINRLVRYGFLLLDLSDTYRYNINNRPEQLLGIKVITGELNVDEASNLAKGATDMPDETPKYIRVLKDAVNLHGIGNDSFLYSGYKF